MSTTDHWRELSARAGLASHRLIGWIYWDPTAIANYTNLSIPNGLGYYVVSRSAPLASAGGDAVVAAFYSIRADFIRLCVDFALQHSTTAAISDARNLAVGDGLRRIAPDICDELASMSSELWVAVDVLPLSGRVLFAAHRSWPRPDDQLLSAWLAVNCIREWRGDTHFAILAAENISGVQAGLLDNAWRGYPSEWIPRSRGADDADLAIAYAGLAERGFVSGTEITAAGVAFRQQVEDRTDDMATAAWKLLGESATLKFVSLIEPISSRFVDSIDATAGPNWMPAARDRK